MRSTNEIKEYCEQNNISYQIIDLYDEHEDFLKPRIKIQNGEKIIIDVGSCVDISRETLITFIRDGK